MSIINTRCSFETAGWICAVCLTRATADVWGIRLQNYNQQRFDFHTTFCNHCGGSANILHKCYSAIAHDSRCAACIILRGNQKKWFLSFLCFRALASSAPIWQFPGMVPCGEFYKIVTQDFARSGHNCDANVRKSWKAINNVSSSGMSSSHSGLIYVICRKNDLWIIQNDKLTIWNLIYEEGLWILRIPLHMVHIC